MRILYVIHDFFPAYYGGAERYVLNLARQMQRLGHEVRVLTYGLDQPVETFPSRCAGLLSRSYVFGGVEVFSLRHREVPAEINFAVADDSIAAACLEVIREHRSDVVHIAHPMRLASSYLAARQHGVPVVLTLTDFWLPCPRGRFFKVDFSPCSSPDGGRKCMRECMVPSTVLRRHEQGLRMFNAVDELIAPSRFLAGVFARCGWTRSTTCIPHGVDYRFVRPQPSPPPSDSLVRFGYIGVLKKFKGIDLLLRSFAAVEAPNITLELHGTLAGDEQFRPELEALIAADPRVRSLGRYDHEDLPEVMAGIDVMVVPSTTLDSYGLVLVESLAFGVPVIASDMVGSAYEYIRDGENGFVFPSDSSAALREVIARIAAEPAVVGRLRSAITLPPRIEEEAFMVESVYRGLRHRTAPRQRAEGNAHATAATPLRAEARPQVAFAELVPSNVLLPGHDSALGRLGGGWRPADRESGVRVRRVAGVAECWLRASAPDCHGDLRVRVRPPRDGGPAGTLTVTCNGASVTHWWPSDDWQEVTLPVRTGPEGRLDVSLGEHPAGNHERSGATGSGAGGCAVGEVRFVPAVPVSPPATTSISVVIPTFNRWPILARTLAALAAQTVRGSELIVVDDGSTDGTWERLAAWRRDHADVRLMPIRQPNLGPGRARNRGLQAATGDLVLFLGDDIIPRPELLAEHLATHRAAAEPIGVLGFTEWDRDHMRVTPFLEFVNGDGQQFAYDHLEDGGDVFFTGFYTSNLSLPRPVLGEQPFHPAFTFVDWEDIELGYRLSLRGLRLIFNPRAAATHLHPMGLRRFYRRQRHVGRTAAVIVGLHPELASSERMPPLDPRPSFRWYGWARFVVPLVVPLLDRWDRLGRRLPPWLYRNILLCAFWTGRREALTG